ncbi:hypothetical protein ACIPPQ_00755 [Sphingopyxis sp. LARHCG72]
MAVGVAVLLLAGSVPIKVERPFNDAAAQQIFVARLSDPLALHEDRRCGDYNMMIGITLPPKAAPRDIRIEAPDCAWERVIHVRKWLQTAPRTYFKPVRHTTRYRFRVAMRLPQ